MDITNDYFVYDPQLYGLNTAFWRELNGTASFTAANTISVSSVTIASKQQYIQGDFIFGLKVPGDPITTARKWGLLIPALGVTKNAVYFEQDSDNTNAFQAVIVSDSGTKTVSAITWDSANWNGQNVEYRILWGKNTIEFYINDLRVASFQDRNINPGYLPLSLYLLNEGASDLAVVYIIAKHVEKVFHPFWEASVASNLAALTPKELSVSPSLSPSVSLSPSKSPSLSPSASPSVSPSVSLSPSISPSKSPSLSPSISPSVSTSPSVSLSPSNSPSISPSVSLSPSNSPSISPSVSLSPSVSISPSASPSPSSTV